MIRYTAWQYAPATQNADGTWTPPQPTTVAEGEWGSLRIEVGATWDCYGTAWAAAGSVAVKMTDGVDVTTISGVPTLIDSLSWAEPYGETTGLVTVPRLTPWDNPGAVAIEPGVNVDIWRVLPANLAQAAGTAELPYWHGHIESVEMADGHGIATGLSLNLAGALYGECRVRAHQPFFLDQAQDANTWISRAIRPLSYARALPPFERFSFIGAETGIELRCRGSRGQSVIDYLDEVLALAKDDDNGTWTISRAFTTYGTLGAYPRARCYTLRQKDADYSGTVQTNSVTAGGYGVAYSLSIDVTEFPTAIYGEGVHPVDSSELSGSRWRNAVYPALTGTPLPYPERVVGTTYPLTTGDTDADFTEPVITQLQAQLRAGGWPDVRITGTFDADTVTALNALYDYAPGHAETGEVADDDDWDLVFGTGTGTTDGVGFFLPLVDVNAYYEYAADGDVVAVSNFYNNLQLRVDEVISYGDGVSKSRARKNARVVVRSATDWVGSITLTSDPIDENQTARSRLDIREGGRIALTGANGNDFYVAGVTVQPEAEGLPVQLTVSTSADDLLALSTRIERNRAAKSDPARSFYSQRLASVRPFRSAVGWDAESGAGLIRSFSAAGSAWEVQRIVGAQYGQVGSLRIDVDPPSPYCFAVFGGSVAGTALDTLIPNPLAALGTADPSTSWWDHPDNVVQLAEWGFVEAWGSEGEAAGFYPGAQSNGTASAAGTATGRLEDAGSWSFASLDPPWLWVAAWVDTAGTATVSGQMRIIIEE